MEKKAPNKLEQGASVKMLVFSWTTVRKRRSIHYYDQPMHRSREDKCHCGVTRAQAPAVKAKHQPAITAAAAARQPDTGMRTAALAVSARVSSV